MPQSAPVQRGGRGGGPGPAASAPRTPPPSTDGATTVDVPGLGPVEFPAGTDMRDPRIAGAIRKAIEEKDRQARVGSVMEEIQASIDPGGGDEDPGAPYGRDKAGKPVGGGRVYGMGTTPAMTRQMDQHLPMIGGIVGGMAGPMGAAAGGALGEGARQAVNDEPLSVLNMAGQGALQAAPTALAKGVAKVGRHYTPTPITHDVNVPQRTSAILNVAGKPIEHGLDEFGRPITRAVTEEFSKARVPAFDAGIGLSGGRRVIPMLRSIGLRPAPPWVGRAGARVQQAAPSIEALARGFILSLMQGGSPPEGE